MEDIVEKIIEDSIKTKEQLKLLCIQQIIQSAELLISTIKNGGKILICGNGGSAADAQHMATELVIHFEKDRGPLPAIALTTDTSILTACGNDYAYEDIFTRQLEAIGQPMDVLIGITTSGRSANILNALQKAHSIGLYTICLTGKDGGQIHQLPLDSTVIVPSNNTARIQESHITIIHIWCHLIEQALFKKKQDLLLNDIP